MATLAQRFHQLFAGSPTAHGVYYPPREATRNDRGKLKGGQAVEATPATPALWAAHLAGRQGLGVFMLRPDATVRFAALDLDLYPLPPEADLLGRLKALKLPLVACASKSGGAHLYLFGREDLPAALVLRRLQGWAARLELPRWAVVREGGRVKQKWEFYPHKPALAGPTDFGKYLNMPYFGAERWALPRVKPEVFLARAAELAVTAAQLEGLGEPAADALKDGPPCLQTLLAGGAVTEYRDQTMLNVAVYLRLRFPDTWEEQLEEYSRRFVVADPLTARDIVKIQRSVGKRDYNYTCRQQPLVACCSKKVCLGREFGVRAQAEAHGQEVGFNLNLGLLRKFDSTPPLYELEVDGQVLRMSTEVLLSYKAFRKVCFEQLNKMPVKLTQDSWDEMLLEKLDTLVVEAAPPDAGDSGRVRWFLEQFCRYLPAQRREELKDGRAWWHEGRVWFRLPHFQDYLAAHRVFANPRDLSAAFRGWGFTHGQVNIQGLCVQYWDAPEFERQREPDPVPRPGRAGGRL